MQQVKGFKQVTFRLDLLSFLSRVPLRHLFCLVPVLTHSSLIHSKKIYWTLTPC